MYETFLSSPLGTIYIKADEEKICEITFVNSKKGKVADEDAMAGTVSENSVIKQCVRELNEYFSGERTLFNIAATQDGTEFQKKVWNELVNIPYGRTISYLQLSKNINNVKAIRAAGTANGSNKVCIIVPCHRVIGSNGSLVGYGGDLWRKQWLLDHEAKYANGVQKLF
ncbi:methylated-DNA--[protein]-cysteine S-methyltransferase [soil metagenome]